MVFRTQAFLADFFRSPQGLLSFLRAYDVTPPGVSAVEKWFQRESVPSDWLPILLGFLEIDRGEPISLAAYLGE